MFEDKPLRRIPLEMIHADERYQPRVEGLDEAHVEGLIKVSDPEFWPPLIVTPRNSELKEVPEDSDFEVNVADGFHRLEAAKRLGLPDLVCRVVLGAGYQIAFLLNLQHGKPLTLADKKAFVRWLGQEYPNMSEREITRRSGLNRNTVRALFGKPQKPQVVQNEPPVEISREAPDPLLSAVRRLDRLSDEGYGSHARREAVQAYIDSWEGKEDRHSAANNLREWAADLASVEVP